jgi:trans-aconitate 2-methyltransferase
LSRLRRRFAEKLLHAISKRRYRSLAMSWHPERYLAFDDYRTRPAADLLARVPLRAPERVVDLGCGPGNSTALLALRWPQADVLGVDSAPAMLAKARERAIGARWLEADIASWTPEVPVDLLFSNAALQWLADHQTLLPRLLGDLRPGGVLAIQMPRNFQAASHVTLRELAAEEPWAARLAGVLRAEPVASPASYHDLLAPLTASLEIWQTEYLQVLEGEDPVLRWTEATALRPVLQTLDEIEGAAFKQAYAARLREAYPRRPDGTTLFPFLRLFIVAQRA